MNPIFNTKATFYDYFNHIPPFRMKMDFDLGYYEQSVIKAEIKKVINKAYDRLVDSHNLRHYDVYNEIGDEFDDAFYSELKQNVTRHFHNIKSWAFLDSLMKKRTIDGLREQTVFKAVVASEVGGDLPSSFRMGDIDVKEALVALINKDLGKLSGRELKYMTKLQ